MQPRPALAFSAVGPCCGLILSLSSTQALTSFSHELFSRQFFILELIFFFFFNLGAIYFICSIKFYLVSLDTLFQPVKCDFQMLIDSLNLSLCDTSKLCDLFVFEKCVPSYSIEQDRNNWELCVTQDILLIWKIPTCQFSLGTWLSTNHIYPLSI